MTLLYDQYSDSLYGVINRIIGDDQLAEDALQKTFSLYMDECHREKYSFGSEKA